LYASPKTGERVTLEKLAAGNGEMLALPRELRERVAFFSSHINSG
jgi:hypothetical protein